MRKPDIAFIPLEKKHIAAFAVGQLAGQIIMSTYFANRHNKEILAREAIIADLKTLSVNLANALDESSPEECSRIFRDLKFDQIVRGVDIDV